MKVKETHEKIIEILKNKGPSLPIQISKEIGLSSLFISAFLSELSHEKKVKISHLKVGGSPLYLLYGQEEQLEKFYNYMHPKEAEAFLLLKKRKILRDTEQKPAIRVALRSIRDFAIGFKVNDEIFWRYMFTPESEIIELIETKKPAIEETEKQQEKIPEPEEIEIQKPIEIIKIKEKSMEIKKKPEKEAFLEEVKFYLNQKNIELVNLETYDKKEVIARIRFNLTPEKIHLLLAYNKKKINDKDLLKAYKKSIKYQLDYIVLFKGELSKKLKDTIDAYKNLFSTEKL
ncbi:MAG: hypothetical protein PHH54_03930 [Candidatus Nanoarchaeia archaeon]|nr:hypothetical protein [Candidatus Nanoarchaeia archaeon]MDD5741109.1 hypothetical protein [Candidatus Nanoarchaeia archaeon]